MYSSPRMYLKVISLKKAKYRKITLSPFLEINNNLYIFDDYFFSLLKCIFFSLFNKTKNIEIIFCDGNVDTLNFKILKYFFKNIKKSILWFNSLNEINNSNFIDYNNYNFFPEQRKFLNKKVKSIIPFPKFIRSLKSKKNIRLSFISEVMIDINDNSYELINSHKKVIKEKIDDFTWFALKEYNFDIISEFDFSFNYISNLSNNYSNDEKINLSNEIYILLKNKLRYLCVKRLIKSHKDDLCLIGKSWEKLGFETFRNNYDYQGNRDIYARSLFSLDCGSTSGEYPIYLRPYEIIYNSSCLFQSMTSFSSRIFQNHFEKICFHNLEDMIKKFKNLKKLQDNEIVNLQNNLFNQIKKNNFKNL